MSLKKFEALAVNGIKCTQDYIVNCQNVQSGAKEVWISAGSCYDDCAEGAIITVHYEEVAGSEKGLLIFVDGIAVVLNHTIDAFLEHCCGEADPV